MSGQDIEHLAERIADKLETRCGVCTLSPEEQEEVKNLLKTKKSSVRAFFWLLGALVVWMLKDVYSWVVGHLSFR